jgi:hypothetical protein
MGPAAGRLLPMGCVRFRPSNAPDKLEIGALCRSQLVFYGGDGGDVATSTGTRLCLPAGSPRPRLMPIDAGAASGVLVSSRSVASVGPFAGRGRGPVVTCSESSLRP